jgi:class 3 adenylate cyclase
VHDNKKLAVLFADVCGSTSLFDQLGDVIAKQLIADCIREMTNEVECFQGMLIQKIGDEIMCTFPSAAASILAACAIQNRITDKRFENGMCLDVRIGCHYGDVISEDGEIFGDTVNVAARIASLAKAGKILTSKDLVDALPDDLLRKVNPIMSRELRGKREEMTIYMVDWSERDDCTNISFAPSLSNPEIMLRLVYGASVYALHKDKKLLTVGRDNHCDILVCSSFASRQHARFELRSGKFYIIDQSTNGSYIRPVQSDVIHISNQEMILQNSGCISLGQTFSDNPAMLINYSVCT